MFLWIKIHILVSDIKVIIISPFWEEKELLIFK